MGNLSYRVETKCRTYRQTYRHRLNLMPLKIVCNQRHDVCVKKISSKQEPVNICSLLSTNNKISLFIKMLYYKLPLNNYYPCIKLLIKNTKPFYIVQHQNNYLLMILLFYFHVSLK